MPKKDNGVLFLVAMEEAQMRIEVGAGLEGVLTDVQNSRINRIKLLRTSAKVNTNKALFKVFWNHSNY